MILAELFDAETEEFFGLVLCNDRHHFEQFLERTQFVAKVEADVIDFGQEIMLQ
jgi:hypothetical protein